MEQQPRRDHFPALDGCRGLAALAIVVFHAYLVAMPYRGTMLHPALMGLEAGVDWFFVLSGFLIFLPIARVIVAGRPWTRRGEFLRRRFWRIMPLYSVVIVTTWSICAAMGQADARDLVAHLAFVHTFDGRTAYSVVAPAWSLAAEVHYYLLIALVAPLLARRCANIATPQARARLVAAGLLGCIIGVVLLRAALPAAVFTLAHPALYCASILRSDPFLLGMLVAMGVAVEIRLPPWAVTALATMGAALAAAGSVARYTWPAVALQFHGIMGLAFALILLALVSGDPGRHIPVLGTRPLRWLGAVSYSLYLWHDVPTSLVEPLRAALAGGGALFWIVTGGLVVFSLCAAAVSYRYIEAPFARHRATPGAAHTDFPHVPARQLARRRSG